MAEELQEIDIQEAQNVNVFYGNSEEEAKSQAIAFFMSQQTDVPIVRPKILFSQVLVGMIIPLLLQAVNLIIYFFAFSRLWCVIPLAIIVFILFLKPSFILFVLLYQKFAPEKIRASCRFEPTCSQYMLLAIKKYGFIKGFCKGVKRLSRCQ